MNPQSTPGAQFAGYSQFYASSAPARPPPRPPAFRPPFVAGQSQYSFQAPHQSFQYGNVPRPQMKVPGPQAGTTTALHPNPPVTTASRWDKTPPPARGPVPQQNNQWQWSTGKAVPVANTSIKYAPPVTVASAPPRPYINKSTSKFTDSPKPEGPTNPVSTNATKSNSQPWPPALKSYVERAFSQCRSDADKTIVQAILKEKISSAMTSNTLWIKNWDAENLPLSSTNSKPCIIPPHQPTPRPIGPPSSLMVKPVFPRPPPPMMAIPMMKPPYSDSFIPIEKKNSNKIKKRKADSNIGFDSGMQKKMQRQERFLKDNFHGENNIQISSTGPLQVLNHEGELDLEAMIIKGTCQKIEKDYLRLTSAPHPSAVRPESILKKALEMVCLKWKKGTCDYLYVVSQMKSIRQDCTVQHIKNKFTVLVYETHARIALEEGDMNEFNQCQTQLRQLYEQGIEGNRREFTAYRILYCIYVCLQGKTDNSGNVGMYRSLSMLTLKDRQDPIVKHALLVREAVFSMNYYNFFHLYLNSPKMSRYIMDAYVSHIRLQALKIIIKSYQPSISIEYIKNLLLLKNKNGEIFLNECGIKYIGGINGPCESIDCKASDIVSVLKSTSKSLL